LDLHRLILQCWLGDLTCRAVHSRNSPAVGLAYGLHADLMQARGAVSRGYADSDATLACLVRRFAAPPKLPSSRQAYTRAERHFIGLIFAAFAINRS
jgi:hypothetical protein